MLYIKQPNGRYRPATDDELFAEAAEARLKLFSAIRKPLTCPSDVGPFIREQLAHRWRMPSTILGMRSPLITALATALLAGHAHGEELAPPVRVEVTWIETEAEMNAKRREYGAVRPDSVIRTKLTGFSVLGLVTVQRFAGHASIYSTVRYVGMNPREYEGMWKAA